MPTNPLDTSNNPLTGGGQSVPRVFYNGHPVDQTLGTVPVSILHNMYGGQSGGTRIVPEQPTGNASSIIAQQTLSQGETQASLQSTINQQMLADQNAALAAGQQYYPVYNRDELGNATNISYFKKTGYGKYNIGTAESDINAFRRGVARGLEPIPTGEGTSYKTTSPPSTNKVFYNQSGQTITGVESPSLQKSYTLEGYNKEVARLASVMPLEQYYNPATKQLFLDDQKVLFTGTPFDTATRTPVRLYVNPKTGQPIEDIGKYLTENRIPTGTTGNTSMTLKEIQSTLSHPIYDVQGLPMSYKQQSFPILQSGSAVPITAEDIAVVAGGAGGIVKGAALGTAGAVLGGLYGAGGKFIASGTSGLIGLAIPEQNTGLSLYGLPAQAARAGLFLASTPVTAVPFATTITESAITNPTETFTGLKEYVFKNPYEAGIMALNPELKLEFSKTSLGDFKFKESPQAFNFGAEIEAGVENPNVGRKLRITLPEVKIENIDTPTKPISFTFKTLQELPIRGGAIRAAGKEPAGLEGIKKDIAVETSKANAYVVGSTVLEERYGKSIIKGEDIDLAITNIEDYPSVRKAIINVLESEKVKGQIEINPELSKTDMRVLKNIMEEEKKNPPDIYSLKVIPIVAEQKGVPKIEIQLRPEGMDKIIESNDMRLRDYAEVINDKKQIVRIAKKLAKENKSIDIKKLTIDKKVELQKQGKLVDPEKLLKAQTHLALIEKGESLFNKPRTLYRGLYLKYGESKVLPIIGIGEDFKPVYGFPRLKDFPSISKVTFTDEGLPRLSRGNIESYPQSAFQTSILVREPILKEVFKGSATMEEDIETLLLTKKARDILKNQRSAFIKEFPKETTILSPKETKFTIEFAQKYPKLYERFYGSFTDIAQMTDTLKRDAHDIEVKLKSEEAAREFGQKYIEEAKQKGITGLRFEENEGMGIYKGKEKAIELKYKGEPNELVGGTGRRYGYKEERGNTEIQKIRSQKQYEQLIRKSATSTTWFKELQPSGKEVNIAEAPLHRPKDIPDVYREIKSLGESYRKIKPIRESLFGRGKKALSIAERYRELKEKVPTGVSKERIAMRQEAADLFKEIPSANKIELTGELKKGVPKPKTGRAYSLGIGNTKNSYNIYNVVSTSKSNILSPSVSASASSLKSLYASPSAYKSPSVSPSPSPSPSPSAFESPYTSPSPSKSTSASPSPYPSPISPSPYPYPPSPPTSYPSEFRFNYGKQKKRRGVRTVPTYSVFIKRRGQYIPAGSGYTKAGAIQREQNILLGSIARSGKIRQTGTREVFGFSEGDAIVNESAFRTFTQRRGKRTPLPYGALIQRSSSNLKSFGEREDLRMAKLLKKQNLFY